MGIKKTFLFVFIFSFIVVPPSLFSMNDKNSSNKKTAATPLKRKLNGNDQKTPTKLPKYSPGPVLKKSPIKPKKEGGIGRDISYYSIYALYAVKEENKFKPNHEERVKFDELLGEENEINEKNLNEALLLTEIEVRKWIKRNKLIFYRTAYIGLAENVTHRYAGHRNDLKSLEAIKALENEDDKYLESLTSSNRKARYMARVVNAGFNIEMSVLVYSIPEQYLKTVEVLVGILLDVLSKANTHLGDGAAWAQIQSYMKWPKRLEHLEKEGLLNLVEDYQNEMFKTSMNL